MQLTELLSISGPEGQCDPPGLAPTPTTEPVSCSLGGRDPNSRLLYPILFPVGVTAGETVPVVPGTIDGLAIVNTVQNQVKLEGNLYLLNKRFIMIPPFEYLKLGYLKGDLVVNITINYEYYLV